MSKNIQQKIVIERSRTGNISQIVRIGIPSVLVVAMVGIAIVVISGYNVETLVANLSPHQPQNLMLQEESYHIGDVEKSYYFHPVPQSNPFRVEFRLNYVPAKATLQITARDIDPDEQSSPVEIEVNGEFVTYLNKYFHREELEPQTVYIPLNPSYFHKGANVLTILVVSSEMEYQIRNLDDIEFWNLKLNTE